MKLLKIKCLFLFLFLSAATYSQTTIFGKVEVDTNLQLNHLADTNASTIRSIGVTSNGSVSLLGPSSNQTYYVKLLTTYADMIEDISQIDAPINSFIKTSLGGKYIVQTDSLVDVVGTENYLVDGALVVEMDNGNFAVLQIREGGYFIEDFGAIPNDNINDSKAIQNCIDAVISLNTTSKVNAGPGEFDLDTGVVISRVIDGDYKFVSLTLSGAIPIYDDDLSIGSGTVFNLRDSTFCIAVQLGRNCLIKNIFFRGSADYDNMSYKDIVEYDLEDWGKNSGARSNYKSPSCAIAIDPFSSHVDTSDRYPNHEFRYTHSSSSGTSMLTIKGCAFREHFIAISNNSSGSILNGDNIRAENIRVRSCNIFWAAGQNQSRSNSIDNVYSIKIKTFVSSDYIGQSSGTPPAITNCNLAGFTKELFSVNTSFSPVRVSNTYIENVFSLGYANANLVSFHQCQIKFYKPEIEEVGEILAAPYLIYNGKQTSFVDCSIEFFSSGTILQPFLFKSKHLSITGGHIEGGIVLSDGYTNAGGEKMHNVQLNNTYIKNKGKIAGKRLVNTPLVNVGNEIMMGGDEVIVNYSVDGLSVFTNHGSTYQQYNIGSFYVQVDSTTGTASVSTVQGGVQSGVFKVGDNILVTTKLDPQAAIGMRGSSFFGSIGYVSEIVNDTTVIISGVPYGYESGTYYFIGVDYPEFITPIWGDIQSGSSTITNVIASKTNNNAYYPAVGTKIFNSEFPGGSYVVAFDRTAGTIELSTEATSSSDTTMLFNADYDQIVYKAKQFPPTSLVDRPYIEGARVYLRSPDLTIFGYTVTRGGYINAIKPPKFGAMTY